MSRGHGRERVNFTWAAVVGLFAVAALVGVAVYGDVRAPNGATQAFTLLATSVFVVAGVIAIRSASSQLHRLLLPLMGPAHASLVRIAVTMSGFLLVAVAAMGLLGVPVQQLLVGGAATGIVVGIAAQQTLSNLFAGVVLLMARPFDVGQVVTVTSGVLGGGHRGRVAAVGLTYVLLDCEGTMVRLPNANVLGAAVITEADAASGPAA
jgi:small-conductance mechanosensitive channel